MGKGGQTQNAAPSAANAERVVKTEVWKSPYDPRDPNAPKYPTKGEIKAVIPAECFERSLVHSSWYLVRDLAMSAALTYATSQLLSTESPSTEWDLQWLTWRLGWAFYAFWQGTIWWGLWVVGHECGHGSYSKYQTLNDCIGYCLHQTMLTPYFPWQYSHAKHHRRTNDIVDGEAYVPLTAEEFGMKNGKRHTFLSELHPFVEDEVFATLEIIVYLFLGWYLYLFGVKSMGRLAADGKPYKGRIPDHFRPNSPMFPAKMQTKIFLSTVGVVGGLGLLWKLSRDYGVMPVALWYWYPYVVVTTWLILYTWLHHTDPSVPHYGPEEWHWVRGALSTIDRDYGIFCWFHHRIGSTHVLHHLFHEIPHYNALKATEAIKEFLEPKGLYNFSPEPIIPALWRVANRCQYVEGLNGIQYYKSLIDLPPYVHKRGRKKNAKAE